MTSHPGTLRADAAVWQRDRLLDAGLVARRLELGIGRGGGVTVGPCRLGCVNYRPGRRVRAVYQVTVDGRALCVGASSFRDRGRAERAYRQAGNLAEWTGPLRPVLYDADLATVFWTFPYDRRIEHLAAVTRARTDLGRLVRGGWAASELVGYNPETSAVVRCRDQHGRVTAYAKVHAGDEGEHSGRVHRAVARRARRSGLRVARPIAYSAPYRTLLVEPVTGSAVSRLGTAMRPAGLYAYGVALARLHSLPLDGIGAGGRDALDRLRHRADGVRMVRPDVTERVDEMLGELAIRWGEATASAAPIHGDTNEDNAILQRGGVALIDFERACAGAPASDLAGVLGLLRYHRALGAVTAADERAQADAFTTGYASVRRLPDPDVLRTHEAAALAERAFRTVTRMRRSAIPYVPSLLAEAKELLR